MSVSFTKEELLALAEAVEAAQKLSEALGKVEARPRDWVIHVDSDIEPGYLGCIGYDEGGAFTFTPALKNAESPGFL